LTPVRRSGSFLNLLQFRRVFTWQVIAGVPCPATRWFAGWWRQTACTC